MSYTRRIQIAACLSLFIHLAALGLYTFAPRGSEPVFRASPEPIVVDLQPLPEEAPPQTPDVPRQLVDVAVPSPAPPPPTDRIAEEHAEAMDLALREADTPGPELEVDEFDKLPEPATPPARPEPVTAPPPAPKPAEEPEPEREKVQEIERDPLPPPRVDELLPEAGGSPNTSPIEAKEGPIKIAQAQAMNPKKPEPGKTRERGGVARQGETNFEAIQSEIAPYLKQVRDKVERQWHQMLYTRYSGTSPVKAVIDCAINPMGELVSVTVASPDGDRIYGALCRDAVQRAGPFGPFPFEVPDIYRGKNLEIRWTFSYL